MNSEDANLQSGTSPTFERLLTDVQVAELLSLHPKTVQSLARKGEIPAIKVGKFWRFSPSSLQRWSEVNSMRQSSPTEKLQ